VNGKAIASGETEGFVKTIFDAKTGALIGAHMIGAEVTEMIQGFALAITLEATRRSCTPPSSLTRRCPRPCTRPAWTPMARCSTSSRARWVAVALAATALASLSDRSDAAQPQAPALSADEAALSRTRTSGSARRGARCWRAGARARTAMARSSTS
jgi:hypothetical protein